ncbi:MAG: zinc ribbon domain-containing protein [Blautia sp.]|nr:zinc ribbon domain-containing protein [Blautia sp.]
MSFLDDFGRRVSDVSQSAVQKGREVADVAKCKAAISDEEKKLEHLYAQLGRLYMSQHKDDPEEIFAGYISAIRASEQKLLGYKNNLGALKNMAKCAGCGVMVPRDSRFCPKCGAPMDGDEILRGEVVK